MRHAALASVLLLATATVTMAQDQAQQSAGATNTNETTYETVARGLVHPWAIAFLPNGRMLVTERPRRMRIVWPTGELSEPLKGLPPLFTKGQGGLLDVVLAPDYQQSREIFFTFAEPGDNDNAGTSLARARLDANTNTLENVEVIFRQEPKIHGDKHFGARIAFAPDGKLFVAMGERFQFEPAQDLSNHLGTIVRINRDGSVPEDNPFVDRKDARPEIYSYGHRNIEAAAVHPETGALWIAEMGPQGGDELNKLEPGRNYGWPVVSWGNHYDGRDIPDPATQPEFADAVYTWTPVISPSGMIVYNGKEFPAWRGSLLIGGLTAKGVVRVALDGNNRVSGEERIFLGARIRDVAEGPDGAIYAATDEENGRILRITKRNDAPATTP